jgi:uncharacterized iron-regulated membrane protein
MKLASEFFIAATFLVLGSVGLAKPRIVHIYFVPWEVQTPVAMSAERVRSAAFQKTTILDESSAESFIRELQEEKMTADASLQSSDLRLVIDVEEEGEVRVFVASRARFGTGSMSRPTDQKFRARFSALLEKGRG